jgi:hypothetical protein
MLQLLNNLIGFVLIWTCILIGICILVQLIYSLATCRYKKIKLYSISQAHRSSSYCLIDTELVHYYVEPNHIFGSKDLLDKIYRLSIGSDYIVKIYSFDTNWTKVKLIDFKPC